MRQPKLVLTPRRAAVLSDVLSHVDVLVRLQAPPRPEISRAAPRTPRHLALVIDRSGSMAGSPLLEAKRCARYIVENLGPTDRVAIISYDNRVTVNHGLCPADNTRALCNAIEAIGDGGMTNLHGGWLAGADQLAPHTSEQTISRVMLLSDGCANEGLTDPQAIFAQCTELARAGVTTTTVGLGEHFNEDLMVGMANAGQGNSYYGDTAADLHDPFQEELALLDALFARGVLLRLKPGAGVQVVVQNDYACTDDGAWRLPDLAYGGEAWGLARLTVAADVARAGQSIVLLQAEAQWRDLDGARHAAEPVTLRLTAMPGAAYAAVAEDPTVVSRVKEITVARLQDEARTAAREGNWTAVARMLETAHSEAVDNPWMEDVVGELKALAARRDSLRFSKEARYSSERMRRRLSAIEEAPHDYNRDGPAYLRRKRAQGKSQPSPGGRK